MRLFSIIQAFALVGILAVPTMAAAKDGKDAGTSLALLAEEAKTPAEHAEVAKQYRAQADDLTATAEHHEAQVKKLERARFPVEVKQMRLGNSPVDRERRLAMEARRGAREAREKALHHTQLAVELMASAR